MKTVSISLAEDLAAEVKAVADREHRSFSRQIAFFCAEGVRHLGENEQEMPPLADVAEEVKR